MLIVLGAVCLVIGTALAYDARRHPVRNRVRERWGGYMVIAGLVLFGAAAFTP